MEYLEQYDYIKKAKTITYAFAFKTTILITA